MANKKKRNKIYKGSVQAIQPSVVKVSAVKRSRAHQWYVDNRRMLKISLIAFGIFAGAAIIITGIISLF
jgi:hypothetical protein